MIYRSTVEGTLARLGEIWPFTGWAFTDNYLVYGGSQWLQFSSPVERRLYWVLVEDSVDVVRTWDLGEIPDLS